MNYEVTITSADGHVFRTAHATIDEVREFMKHAALVLLPGETLSFVVL
jgi:putative intracellular protease/amidase